MLTFFEIVGFLLCMVAWVLFIVLGVLLVTLLAKDAELPADPEDINCPVCGYYCTGKGALGCIDKPFYVKNRWIYKKVKDA
jgi:hypothetical protein